MSKIKLMLDVVNDMRSLADGLEALANAMADGGNQPKEHKPMPSPKTDAPAVTHEMLRELAVKLSRRGRREEIKELLGTYGVKNITAVADGFGTGDLVIVADAIQVIDFKYGKGVAVSAENNSQMMLYALGALNLYDYLYDIKTVKMSIVQPRLGSISEWEISVDDLLSWAENTLKPTAALAAKGEGEFKAGEHCRFCKLRSTCRARAELMLEAARYEFAEPATLSDNEIAGVLTIASDLSKWAEDVFAYVQAKAINEGKHWDGFKVVEGRSNRKYADEKKVAEICRKNGYQISQIYKNTLIGITDMEKLFGKRRFKELLGDCIVKPKGKLTLVPETDKCEEVHTTSEFSEIPLF